jgi:Fe-S-cluster containining protein
MFRVPILNDKLPDGWDDAKAEEVVRKSVAATSLLSDEEYGWLKSIVPPQVNQCGSCNVCCRTPAIEEDKLDDIIPEQKPACVSCVHLNGGCSIYDNRPEVCRNYLCAYAMGCTDIHPTEHDCAWSFQVSPDGNALLIGHASSVERVLSSERIVNMIDEACKTGAFYAVTIRDDQKAVSIECSSLLSQIAMVDQSDPLKQQIVPSSIRDIGFGIPFIQG